MDNDKSFSHILSVYSSLNSSPTQYLWGNNYGARALLKHSIRKLQLKWKLTSRNKEPTFRVWLLFPTYPRFLPEVSLLYREHEQSENRYTQWMRCKSSIIFIDFQEAFRQKHLCPNDEYNQPNVCTSSYHLLLDEPHLIPQASSEVLWQNHHTVGSLFPSLPHRPAHTGKDPGAHSSISVV